MRFFVKCLIVLAILGGGAAAAYKPSVEYMRQRNKPEWETAAVIQGDAVRTITTSGKIRPVLQVSIGSFVSGPIVEICVDFNDEVEEGDLLARVDPRLFAANVARDEAILATREADVARVQAQLQQSINNKQRGEKLRQKNEDFLSDREMDALVFETQALEAQLKLSQASVRQAQASLENSQANLGFCEIRSPVKGVVIDRMIDPGQTLASQFQAPELFIIAPDLREKVHVFASVDEQDIGLLQKAFEEERPVSFTVSAYEGRVFEGLIEQIRISSTELQNVVTYPVVVAAENPGRELLPGMTATISFEVDTASDVLKVPNSALRFYPEDVQYVREEDRGLLDGSRWTSTDENDADGELSAEEQAEAQREKSKRHVWVQDGDMLRAVEIVRG
ncbi:MAG: efflux RND transporter periplasmic adaptor subunit [Aureliella sp.]